VSLAIFFLSIFCLRFKFGRLLVLTSRIARSGTLPTLTPRTTTRLQKSMQIQRRRFPWRRRGIPNPSRISRRYRQRRCYHKGIKIKSKTDCVAIQMMGCLSVPRMIILCTIFLVTQCVPKKNACHFIFRVQLQNKSLESFATRMDGRPQTSMPVAPELGLPVALPLRFCLERLQSVTFCPSAFSQGHRKLFDPVKKGCD
jgi:hypothetical protein